MIISNPNFNKYSTYKNKHRRLRRNYVKTGYQKICGNEAIALNVDTDDKNDSKEQIKFLADYLLSYLMSDCQLLRLF